MENFADINEVKDLLSKQPQLSYMIMKSAEWFKDREEERSEELAEIEDYARQVFMAMEL